MNIVPVQRAPLRPAYPEPAPADYTDEVTDANLAALKEASQDEFENEDLEAVGSPAW